MTAPRADLAPCDQSEQSQPFLRLLLEERGPVVALSGGEVGHFCICLELLFRAARLLANRSNKRSVNETAILAVPLGDETFSNPVAALTPLAYSTG